MNRILTRTLPLLLAAFFIFGSATALAAESPEPSAAPDILDTLHNGAPPAAPIASAAPESAVSNPASEPPIVFTTPQSSATPEPTPKVPALYPVDVRGVEENGTRTVIKTYELGEGESPDWIPRESFEHDGWQYVLTDILRKETAANHTREHTETVTVNSATSETSEIMPLLAPTLDFTSEDGYAGTLELDLSTVTVEQAGTKTSSFTKTVTREYPRLSENDTNLLPKTVEDGGRTYTLTGVDWRAGNLENIDYTDLPQYYTAVATYSRTGTSVTVTGYVTTAEYKGTISKLIPGKTVYTAYFAGTPIEPAPEPTPEATPEPTPEPEPKRESANPIPAVAGTTAGVGLLGGVVFFFFFRKNVKVHNLKDGKYAQIGKTRVTAKNPVINLTTFADKAASGSFILALDALAAKSLSGKTVTVNYGDRSLQHIVNNDGGEYQFEVDF